MNLQLKSIYAFLQHVLNFFAFSIAGLIKWCPYYTLPILRALHFKGKKRIIQYIDARCLPDEITIKVLGVDLKLNLKDEIQKLIYFNTYDYFELKALRQLIPEKGIFLDIGANIGLYSLILAGKTGPEGKIYAFEPDPKLIDQFVSNIQLNHFDHFIKIFPLALSDKEGVASFFKSSELNSGWGTLNSFGFSKQENILSVSLTTIDKFFHENGLTHVDLLKMDVEAHEPEVLKGASETLKKGYIKRIYIEFCGPRLSERGYTFKSFCSLLEQYDYRLVSLLGSDIFSSLNDPHKNIEEKVLNLLFIHSSVDFW